MTEHQEKVFKNYVETIESLNRKIADFTRPLNNNPKELNKIRVKFLKWFRKQIS